MNHNSKDLRLISIAPSTRGFGFAVMEDQKLIDWGVKKVKGDKNKQTLKKVEKLIHEYQPGVVTIEDADAKGSRRRPRIRRLVRQIVALARSCKVKIKLISRNQLKQTFFNEGKGTKQDLAGLLAEWYPEELANRLPTKREIWDSEDSRMDIFDAVAFGVAFSLKR